MLNVLSEAQTVTEQKHVGKKHGAVIAKVTQRVGVNVKRMKQWKLKMTAATDHSDPDH